MSKNTPTPPRSLRLRAFMLIGEGEEDLEDLILWPNPLMLSCHIRHVKDKLQENFWVAEQKELGVFSIFGQDLQRYSNNTVNFMQVQ